MRRVSRRTGPWALRGRYRYRTVTGSRTLCAGRVTRRVWVPASHFRADADSRAPRTVIWRGARSTPRKDTVHRRRLTCPSNVPLAGPIVSRWESPCSAYRIRVVAARREGALWPSSS